jgi:hypothetical protein
MLMVRVCSWGHYYNISWRSYESILPYNPLHKAIMLQDTVPWHLVLYCIENALPNPNIPTEFYL